MDFDLGAVESVHDFDENSDQSVDGGAGQK